ncbi:MAG: 30S ribosome-binding factor RbfA [Actinomycetota bacterium]
MSERTARVAEEFREVLAGEIPRLKDPRIGFITVTRVDVTPDLRKAHVWYTIYGDDKAKAGSRAGLRSSRSRLRQVLGQQVRLKFTPELEFHEDMGMENLGRVDELLKRDEGGPGGV